jgi:hypothetical protein
VSLDQATTAAATAQETQEQESPYLKRALFYAKQGLPVFPLHRPHEGGCSCGKSDCTNIGKHPRFKPGFLAATTDETQIREWWEFDCPLANIGIRTGKESGIVVLDIDPKHGGDESLHQLEAKHGPLPDTPIVLSGGGGKHLYFKYPGSNVRTTSGVLGPGLDTRGDGGYIIAPGSVHASGRYYKWEKEKSPGHIPFAPLPAWLLTLLEETYTQKARAWVEGGSNGDQPIPAGERNDALFALGCSYRRRGLDEEEIAAILLAANDQRCTPPLPQEEVQRIVQSIAKYPVGPRDKTPQQEQRVPRLQSQSAQALANQDLGPVQWVVPGLIAEGLTLLVGGAKIGKSWAALGMGLAVAMGDLVFQYFETEQGGVLYLALEDGPRRIKDRMDVLLQGYTTPENLQFVYECPVMPTLVESLKEWVADHPGTRLVIVDVLARIRKGVRKPHDPYLADYEALAPLQRFAIEHGIGVVVVHHTNQAQSVQDILHTVNGTTGTIGVADTVLIFQRARNQAGGALHVTSRDLPEGVFTVEFHNGVWIVQGKQGTPKPGPEPTALTEAQAFLRSRLADGPRHSTEVQKEAKAAGISEMTLRRAQKDLQIKSKKDGKGWSWSLPAVRSGSAWDEPLNLTEDDLRKARCVSEEELTQEEIEALIREGEEYQKKEDVA